MYLMRNHDVWIYVRCANSDPRIAFDRLYDLIDEAAGHGFLVRGTSFDHCSGNTLKDRIGLRSMLDAVENGRIEAVMVRDLEQISRNSYILVGVIEILRQNDVYAPSTKRVIHPMTCPSNAPKITVKSFPTMHRTPTTASCPKQTLIKCKRSCNAKA